MDQDETLHVQSPRRQCQQCLVEPCACLHLQQVADAERRMQCSAKNAIMFLLKQQQKLKTNFNHRNDPLGQLPLEVATHIFAFCIDSTDYTSMNQTLRVASRKPFQFALGEICQTWRHIVWSYPQFWKRILIFLQQSDTSPAQAAFLQEWIERSGQLPLSVFIMLKMDWRDSKPLDVDLASRIFDPLIPMLNSVAHRWSFLYAKIPSLYLGKLKVEYQQRPQLKELILLPTDDDDIDIANKHFDLGVAICPNLLQVTGLKIQNLQMQWGNLNYFYGLHLSVGDCINILEWAPQLLGCNLSDISPADMPLTKHVVNHSVTTFVVDDHEEIFNFLTLPALRELHCGLAEDSFAHALSGFIIRSGCKLEAATFSESSGDDHDLLDFLALTPSLSRLYLSDVEIGHTFLSRLGETSFIPDDRNSAHLLPHLQHFYYRYSCHNNRFEWSSVATMSLIQPPQPDMVRRPLNSIHFEIDPEEDLDLDPGMVGWPEKWDQLIDKKSLEKMLEVIDSGIDLHISEEFTGYDIIQVSKEYHRLGLDQPSIDPSLFEFTIL